MDALINAGTERSVLDLAHHFSDGVEVHVAYFYPRHDLKEAFEQAGIPVHFLDLKGKYSFPQGIKRLKQLLRTLKPDIMVSSLLRANLISRLVSVQTKIPIVGTFVSDSYSPARTLSFSQSKRIRFNFFKQLDRWTSGIPVRYIANSKSIAKSNAIHLAIPEDKIAVVYRGREPSKFPEWSSKKSTKPFVFATTGRLLKTKGFHEALEALKKIHKFREDVRLIIYGEGEERKVLEAKIRKMGLEGKVSLPGNVPNAWQQLYEAHAFIFPSWYEGFSGALVEAMMVGLPIVASNIPMNMEAVDPTCARIHQVKNADDLALHMLWVMDHYEEACAKGQKAREIAMERFDIRKVAREYEEVLFSSIK